MLSAVFDISEPKFGTIRIWIKTCFLKIFIESSSKSVTFPAEILMDKIKHVVTYVLEIKYRSKPIIIVVLEFSSLSALLRKIHCHSVFNPILMYQSKLSIDVLMEEIKSVFTEKTDLDYHDEVLL